jgi:DNA-binding response OmpR family regulator
MLLGDVGAPSASVELIRSIRNASGLRTEPSPAVPVVALVDSADELGVLRTYQVGADDVLDRRSSYAILRAHLLVVLGRAGSRAHAPTIRIGALELSTVGRCAWLRGEPLELPAKEFALLSILASDPTRVFTRTELLRDVWGYPAEVRTRTLDSHAARLRHKLRVHGDDLLVNAWGVGYRLMDALPAPVAKAA